MSHFRPVRRILTSHSANDTDGNDVVIFDDQVPLSPIGDTGNVGWTAVYASQGLPVPQPHTTTPQEIEQAVQLAPPSIVTPGGINLRCVEMAPGERFEMHRTSSLDHAIILEGSINLITPTADGKERWTLAKAGDVVMQCGTLHAWQAGEQGVRLFSVIVAAEPVKSEGGEALPDVSL